MHYTPSTIPDEAVEALRPAFDHFGLHSAEEWVLRCSQDLAQLWHNKGLWAITEVHAFASGVKACHVVAMAGIFNKELWDEIEAWAQSIGCTHVHFTGRRGWERKLPDYKSVAVVMQKEIV